MCNNICQCSFTINKTRVNYSRILACLLCWSGPQSPPCLRQWAWGARCSPGARRCWTWAWPPVGCAGWAHPQTWCWTACPLGWTSPIPSHLITSNINSKINSTQKDKKVCHLHQDSYPGSLRHGYSTSFQKFPRFYLTLSEAVQWHMAPSETISIFSHYSLTCIITTLSDFGIYLM